MATISLGAWILYNPTPRAKEPAMSPPCTCGHRHPMGLFGTSTGDLMDPPRVAPQAKCTSHVVVPSLKVPGESFTANCPCTTYTASTTATNMTVESDGEWGDPQC